VRLYQDLQTLRGAARTAVAAADAVVLGSYVPDGAALGRWLREAARGTLAFYDIDTPVTLEKLARGDHEYLEPALIPAFDVYLSFTGGAVLETLERRWGAQRAVALYCAVDAQRYAPLAVPERWTLGYLGTYSADRQAGLERLLFAPARAWPHTRFAVAGPQYPADTPWPPNVTRIEHLAPGAHAAFYGAQRATLNLTRAAMRATGHAPSVRLFEAAACGVPVISDRWAGIERFFAPDREILLAGSAAEVLDHLDALTPARRLAIGAAARERVLGAHTAAHRAAELERALLGERA
jgi:spore maturation protein CgeB